MPLLVLGAACGGGFERGAPIPEANEIAQTLHASTGPESPTRVVFDWEYADDRGNYRGEGVARVNPRDRFRLDLFATGEGSLQATLVDGAIETNGDLDDIELPPSVFMYAMAGVFRPGASAPTEGFQSREYSVLAYQGDNGTQRYFYLLGDRLTRIEERRDGRRERWIELEWGENAIWPSEARYRDEVTPNGVRWSLVESHGNQELYGPEIYVLPRH